MSDEDWALFDDNVCLNDEEEEQKINGNHRTVNMPSVEPLSQFIVEQLEEGEWTEGLPPVLRQFAELSVDDDRGMSALADQLERAADDAWPRHAEFLQNKRLRVQFILLALAGAHALLTAASENSDGGDDVDSFYLRACSLADRAFIVGAPASLTQPIVLSKKITQSPSSSATAAAASATSSSAAASNNAAKATVPAPTLNHFDNKVSVPVVTDPLSVAQFKSRYYDRQVPVLLRNQLSAGQGFRCLDTWKTTASNDGNEQTGSWAFLRQPHGHRLVPVELGTLTGRPETSTWREQIMTVNQFVDQVQRQQQQQQQQGQGQGEPVYLAQFSLFDHVPELRADFVIPKFCSAATPATVDRPPVSCWFGTSNTTTPLHFDSDDNCFVQVSGWKLFLLFHPDDANNLYVNTNNNNTKNKSSNSNISGGGGDAASAAAVDSYAQKNISSLPLEHADVCTKFPLLQKATVHVAIVGPGDCLFIPSHWYHYVRALSSTDSGGSLSLSFWF